MSLYFFFALHPLSWPLCRDFLSGLFWLQEYFRAHWPPLFLWGDYMVKNLSHSLDHFTLCLPRIQAWWWILLFGSQSPFMKLVLCCEPCGIRPALWNQTMSTIFGEINGQCQGYLFVRVFLFFGGKWQQSPKNIKKCRQRSVEFCSLPEEFAYQK